MCRADAYLSFTQRCTIGNTGVCDVMTTQVKVLHN